MTPTATRKKVSLPPIVPIGAALLVGALCLFIKQRSYLPASGIDNRMTVGNQVLITANATLQKQDGVKAFSNGDFQEASRLFKASLRQNPNDPEALIALNNAQIDTNSSLMIAVSVPISSNLNIAQEILRGVAQAQSDINRNSGINGQLLKVAIIDDENDPEIAKTVATALAEDPRVLAVVGHNASDASLAAAPIYQKAGLVMISPTSLANALSGMGNYILRTVPTVRSMTEPLANYVVKTVHKPKIVTCYDTQAKDGISFRDEFAASLTAQGGRLIETHCDFASSTWNADTAVADAVRGGADGILLVPHIDRLDRAIDLARAVKGRLALFGSPTLYTFKTIQAGQSVMNGLVLPGAWHPAIPAAKIFASKARQLWGGEVNWRTATAYDATEAIIAGLNKNTSRSGLQEAIRNPNFSATGAGEPVKFLPTGDVRGTPLLLQIQPSLNGYDFAPVH
jgi:branched-chain amino acid transport system substrate-binding protein